MKPDDIERTVFLLTIIGALVLFFLPTIIAFRRGMRFPGCVLLINLLLASTGIGWLVALIWACAGETKYQAYDRQAFYHHARRHMEAAAAETYAPRRSIDFDEPPLRRPARIVPRMDHI